MMKLQRLKPRLQVQKKPEQKTVGNWRSGKSSTQRGYGYIWQKFRLKFLQLNPLCVYCQRKGLTVEATVVDHITPHRGDMVLFWKNGNHQSLCQSCHSSVKQSEENQIF